MNNEVMFSSKTDMWATPQDFYNKYNNEFNFTLDVCATATNAKCGLFYTEEQDGLSQEWGGVCWMNPPYGRGIKQWIKKAYDSAQNGATVVCLVPCRTDTAWWHDYCMKANRIDFIKGRLRFGDAENNAPFPSAVVVFKPLDTTKQ